MKIAFFIAVLLLATQPAFAEDKKRPVVDPAACRQLTEYVPSAHANADYKAGTDASGKTVAPADVSRSAIQVPRVIKFGIDVDVAQYAGIPVPAGQNLTNIGTIELDTKTGDMDFNGQPVEGDALARIRYLCRTVPPTDIKADVNPNAESGSKEETKEILNTPDDILHTPPDILHTPDNILDTHAPTPDSDKHNQ